MSIIQEDKDEKEDEKREYLPNEEDLLFETRRMPKTQNTISRLLQLSNQETKNEKDKNECFVLEWKHITNAMKHELYDKISTAFMLLINGDQQYDTLNDLLTNLGTKLHIHQKEINYIKHLIQRAKNHNQTAKEFINLQQNKEEKITLSVYATDRQLQWGFDHESDNSSDLHWSKYVSTSDPRDWITFKMLSPALIRKLKTRNHYSDFAVRSIALFIASEAAPDEVYKLCQDISLEKDDDVMQEFDIFDTLLLSDYCLWSNKDKFNLIKVKILKNYGNSHFNAFHEFELFGIDYQHGRDLLLDDVYNVHRLFLFCNYQFVDYDKNEFEESVSNNQIKLIYK